MMRMSSLSNVKKSGKKNQDHRTTKTKASASKPEMFTMSLARNKYNPNPSLFNSVKKQNKEQKFLKSNKENYQSEKKKSHNNPNEINLYESLHTKISFDYINSLYSDIGLQFGIRIKDQLENKENVLKEKNLNLSVKLPLKEEKECLDKIVNLIKLKESINSAYESMKNTKSILSYVLKEKENEEIEQVPFKEIKTFSEIHETVSNFLSKFRSLDQELETLEQKYEQHVEKINQIKEESSEDEDEVELDAIIESLKNQITEEKNLSIRYEREEKFLISKLYFTQKKNNDLKASSSNLQIKNTNLRDTIRLSITKPLKINDEEPKNLRRSLSVKLQRIKKYNLEDDFINIENPKTERKITRSKSVSSLGNTPLSSTYFPNRQKETFLDKIY